MHRRFWILLKTGLFQVCNLKEKEDKAQADACAS